MKIVRIIRKFIVVALALVGANSVATYFWPKNVPPLGVDVIVNVYPSPDAMNKAAVVYYSSGGAISPNCSTAVSILPASRPNADAHDAKFVVFTGDCEPFAPRNGKGLNSPIIEWTSNTTLKITSSINSSLLIPAKVTMKKRDASGQVTLQYEVHE